jgi:hypothetical protein
MNEHKLATVGKNTWRAAKAGSRFLFGFFALELAEKDGPNQFTSTRQNKL